MEGVPPRYRDLGRARPLIGTFLLLLCASERPSWTAQVSRSRGMSPSDAIERTEIRVQAKRPLSKSVDWGVELGGERFTGERDGRAVRAFGGGLVASLAWNFLPNGVLDPTLVFGWGGAFYTSPFPPGGTRWNGTSWFGLDLASPAAKGLSLVLSLRELHHSNGRGMVATNPAYDAYDLGIGVRWQP